MTFVGRIQMWLQSALWESNRISRRRPCRVVSLRLEAVLVLVLASERRMWLLVLVERVATVVGAGCNRRRLVRQLEGRYRALPLYFSYCQTAAGANSRRSPQVFRQNNNHPSRRISRAFLFRLVWMYCARVTHDFPEIEHPFIGKREAATLHQPTDKGYPRREGTE